MKKTLNIHDMEYSHIIKIVLLLSVFVFTMACGQKSEQKKSVMDKVKSTSTTLNTFGGIKEERTTLKAKKPMAVKKLEDWLPETVKGMQKTKSGTLEQEGITGVNAQYIDQNNPYGKDYANKFNILIIDGYGERGSTAVLEYITIKHADGKAEYDNTMVKESFDQRDQTYTLKFLYNDRFGVEIWGKGFDKNELWEVFKTFHLEQLN